MPVFKLHCWKRREKGLSYCECGKTELKTNHAWEEECEKLRAEVGEQASGVLKLAESLRYLNGMVKRGRGEDISTDVEANIKGYVIELEQSSKKLRAEVERLECCEDYLALYWAQDDRDITALEDENEQLRDEVARLSKRSLGYEGHG